MNYIRYFLLLFLPIYAASQGNETDPCPPTGVTTNPQNPVALHPSYENNFDWTANQYPAFAANQSFNQVNPYFASGTPVSHLSPNTFRDDSPEQGWELVFYDLGYDINNNLLLSGAGSGHLYIVMYNKYRSIVRVFVAIVPDDPGNIVEISLKTSSPQATALLAAVDKVQAPLNEFDRDVIASNAQQFVPGSPGQYQWHYADFPVAYDPCTCTLPNGITSGTAKLTIRADVNDEAVVNLLGVSTGSVKVSKPASGPVNQENWNDFYGTVKKAGDLISKGKKAYKSFSSFKADVETTATGKEKETEIKSGVSNIESFLVGAGSLLSKVPYVAQGLAIIDFFIGGGEKTSAVKLPPMSIQLEHEFSGTLSFFDRYFSHDLYIPGSNFTPSSGAVNLDRSYPLYNEVLGLFNLLERPKVEIWKGNVYYEEEVVRDYNGNTLSNTIQNGKVRRAFKIDQSSIKLALNSASNLTISEAFLQLTFKKSGGQLGFSEEIEGFEINRDTWVSPLVPLACAGERLLYTDMDLLPYTQLPGSGPEEILTDEVLISIVLSLKAPNGNKYLHKATFPVEITSENQYPYSSDEVITDFMDPSTTINTYTFDWFNKQEFVNYQRSLFSSQSNLAFNNQIIDEDQSAQTSINLVNTTVLNNSSSGLLLREYTSLKAGNRIFIDAGSEIEKNSELEIVGLIEQNCEAPVPLANPQQIAATCNSTSYLNSANPLLGKKSSAMNDLVFQNAIELYPNPASEYLIINLNCYYVPVESIDIIVQDFSGRIIKNESLSPEGFNEFRVKTNNLSSGLYLISIRKGDRLFTEQFKVN